MNEIVKMRSIYTQLLEDLQEFPSEHRPGRVVFDILRRNIHDWNRKTFGPYGAQLDSIEPFGTIRLPFFRMGNVDSADLFGLNELIIFAFYAKNRDRYKTALDLGANIGLHTLLMKRLGWDVSSFEPDPLHFKQLQINLETNDELREVYSCCQMAVSAAGGKKTFVRVLGNTTGSHLDGAKPKPYGETERFEVATVAFSGITTGIDFCKMDVEGAEAELTCSLPHERWRTLDCLLEVGSPETAKAIFEHFRDAQSIKLFSQRIGWSEVIDLNDMPQHHSHGSLFISENNHPWEG